MFSLARQHRGKVTGICYSPNGDYLYSCGSLGSLALHDAENNYQLMRLLGNTVARGEVHGPDALTVSPDGLKVAFVGPSDFTVSVVDGRSLDEVSYTTMPVASQKAWWYWWYISKTASFCVKYNSSNTCVIFKHIRASSNLIAINDNLHSKSSPYK